jgi:putative membrane protein insertion efficiency factor
MTSWAQMLSKLPSELLIAAVRVYQRTLGLLLGPRCRFVPSCSSYCILAIRKYGAFRGSLRGVARICRCHPWHPGGYDPP